MLLQKQYKLFFIASLNDKTQLNDRSERQDISCKVYTSSPNKPNLCIYFTIQFGIGLTIRTLVKKDVG